MFWRVAPETVWKNSLDVRSAVSGFVLSSFGFSPTSLLFLFVFPFERQRSGSNRTPPHTPVFVVRVLFFCPPRLAYRPCWPCVPLLSASSGCHSGPPRFCDSPGTHGA